MNIINTENITPIIGRQNIPSEIQKITDNQTSFKDTLKSMLTEVNDEQLEASKKVQQFLKGEITDVHQVMIAGEKASVSMELTLAIRNKLLDAYRQIMRMQG
jgi:flagellar hook-basal body complex protein FliE